MQVYKKPLLDVMQSGNKTELNFTLAQFKDRGIVKFDKVLSIPLSERIPSITTDLEGRMKVSAALSASIKSAFGNINLRVGLNDDQIIEIAEQIIDQSVEDFLSLEDVLLFLQQLVTGKAGKIYDRMDVPTFFELFETYRQERHEQLIRIKNERHQNLKSQGPSDRSCSTDPIKDQMVSLGNRVSNLNAQLKEQREINRMKKFESGMDK